MGAKRYTGAELKRLKDMYLTQGLSIGECAKKLKRPHAALSRKITTMGWSDIRKSAEGIIVQELDDQKEYHLTKSSKLKGETLAKEFLNECALRAAAASTTGLDYFEAEAKKRTEDGELNGDLDRMDTALKIAERAANFARKSMGIDGVNAGGRGPNNVFYTETVTISKSTPEPEDEVIDV